MVNAWYFDLESTIFEILILIYLLFGRNAGRGKKERYKIFIYFCAMVTSVYGMSELQVSIAVKIAAIIFLTGVLSTRINNKSFKYGILMGTIFIMSVSVSDIITMGLLHSLMSNLNYMDNPNYMNQAPFFYTITICISKTILLFIVWITKKVVDKRFTKINFGNWMIITLPHLFNLILLLIIGYRMYYRGSVARVEALLLIGLALMLFISTFCNIITSEYYYDSKELEHKNKMNMEQLQLQYEYYKSLQQDQLKVRELYHDMKSHLLVLRSNLETGQKEKYINNLLLDMKSFENHISTGNDFLNCIINEKRKEAIAKGIDFSALIDFSDITFMNPIDICTIFSNAIDNAIEACDKIETSTQKSIVVKAGRIRNFVSITFENSTVSTVVLDFPIIITTKHDKYMHGFGLKNINKVVEKYQGESKIKQELGKFALYLLIPYNSN